MRKQMEIPTMSGKCSALQMLEKGSSQALRIKFVISLTILDVETIRVCNTPLHKQHVKK